MLVTFSSSRYSKITMFGDVAIPILKLMGHSGTVPGAILAKDVPAALANLEAGIEAVKQLPESNVVEEEEDEDAPPPVSISHRALPLIDLLKAAVKAESDVMWTDNK